MRPFKVGREIIVSVSLWPFEVLAVSVIHASQNRVKKKQKRKKNKTQYKKREFSGRVIRN